MHKLTFPCSRLRVLALALLALAWPATPARAQEKDRPAKPQSQQAELNKRGAEAMGFEQQKITHHFRLLRAGGLIEVQANDEKDADSIARIRKHLAEQAKRFGQGDFSAPEHTHAEVPPGVPTMVKLAAKIQYEYLPTPRGGKLRISSADPEAVAAVHEFLKYQTEQHHTGDSMHVH